MPITYKVDKTRRHVSTVVEGSIRVEDIIGHFEAARREQWLAYSELIDACGVTPPYLAATDVWRAGAWVREQRPEFFGPRAVILAGDVVFGMTRVFTTIVSGFFPIEAFRDAAAAEEWLARKAPAEAS